MFVREFLFQHVCHYRAHGGAATSLGAGPATVLVDVPERGLRLDAAGRLLFVDSR